MTEQPRKKPICSECGMELQAWGEFHPLEACILVRAGCDPRKFLADYLSYEKARRQEKP